MGDANLAVRLRVQLGSPGLRSRGVCASSLEVRLLGAVALHSGPLAGARRAAPLSRTMALGCAGHHRVSREFLAQGSELRAAIDAMCDDESNMSERLRKEVCSLSSILPDDAINEGPHAVAKRVQAHARGSKFAWQASTMRLNQNLGDIQEMLPVAGLDLKLLWCSWKSIVQVSESKQVLITKMMKHRTFEDHVYRMSKFYQGDGLADVERGRVVAVGHGEGATGMGSHMCGGCPNPANAGVVLEGSRQDSRSGWAVWPGVLQRLLSCPPPHSHARQHHNT